MPSATRPVIVDSPMDLPPSAALTAAAAPPPEAEACPPPLQWAEVVEAFGRGARIVETSVGHQRVRATQFGSGPPLYVLPGPAGDARLFSLLAWLLRDERTLVILDYLSERSRQSPVEAAAQSVSALASLLGHQQVDLFATQFGCDVALELIRTTPTQVRAAILHAPDPDRRWAWFERLLLWFTTWSRRPLLASGSWRRVQELNHRRWFPPFDPTRWEFLVNNLGGTPRGTFAQRLLALGRASAAGPQALSPTAADSPVRLLLLRTEGEGRRLAEAAERLKSCLPMQEEWQFAAGFYPHVTHPHRVAKVVRNWPDASQT